VTPDTTPPQASTHRRVRVTLYDGRVAEGREGDLFNVLFGLDSEHRPMLTWHQVRRFEIEDGDDWRLVRDGAAA
jgi:hypothetical protein